MDPDVVHLVLGQVHDFVRKVVVPAEPVIEETEEITEAIRTQAAEMGLFGFTIPTEYGGLGGNMSEEARIVFEPGSTTPAFRSLFGTNNGIAGQVLVNFGTQAQKLRWLPKLASGEAIAAFNPTEQEAGSHPSGLKTRAVPTPEGYRISGSKRFITNAERATVHMVFARTTDDDDGTKGISVFAVPAGTPGVTVGERDAKMGQHGSTTSDVYFDNVLVPHDALIGGVEGEGFAAAMRSLAKGRLYIAALCVGLAERLVEQSVTAAKEFQQGGAPIARFQLVQAMLAESQAETYAGRGMVMEAAKSWDANTDRRLAPSCARLYCTEMVGRVADHAVQVHGGMG